MPVTEAQRATAVTAAPADNTAAGIAAMVGATLFFTCGDALLKLLAGGMPTSQLISLRSAMSTVIAGLVAAALGHLAGLGRLATPALSLRALGDIGGSVFFVAALLHMPFADMAGILQTMPLCLTAISALLLGEQVGWRRWTAVIVGLGGALLIVKPGTAAFNAWSILAFLAVASSSLRDVATRRIDAAIPPLAILAVSQAAVALFTTGGLLVEQWIMPAPSQMLLMLIASVLSILGHLCVIYAVRAAAISAVAPFRYAAIIWAIILGLVIWGETPDAWSLAGIAILTSAGLYTLHRERRLRIERIPQP
jgi:drug/metabolite transporter (DMT)-like permease